MQANNFIDRRVRAKEFMHVLSVSRFKFYDMMQHSEIKQPTPLTKKDVFWHVSYVKEKVEEHKS